MSKIGDGCGERVVIRSGFWQSRHEVEFAAVAYEIVAPIISWKLSPGLGDTGKSAHRKFGWGRPLRRQA